MSPRFPPEHTARRPHNPGKEETMDSVGDLDRIGRSCKRHLRAEGTSARTVDTYGESVGQLRTLLLGLGVDDVVRVTREHLEMVMEHLHATGSPATARCGSGHCSISFAGWSRTNTSPLTPWRPCGCRNRPSNLFPSRPSSAPYGPRDQRREATSHRRRQGWAHVAPKSPLVVEHGILGGVVLRSGQDRRLLRRLDLIATTGPRCLSVRLLHPSPVDKRKWRGCPASSTLRATTRGGRGICLMLWALP